MEKVEVIKGRVSEETREYTIKHCGHGKNRTCSLTFEATKGSNGWVVNHIKTHYIIPREVFIKIESILRGLNS